MHKVGVFFPCFNVAKTAVPVLDALLRRHGRRIAAVLIFDNQSTDRTVDSLLSYLDANPALTKNVRLFRNRTNASLGGSTMLAFKQALALDLDFLISLHSDGQADVKDLDVFFSELERDEPDFIFGSRFMAHSKTEDYSRVRIWGNRFFNLVQRLVTGKRLTDIASMICFRMQTIRKLPFDRVSPYMHYQPLLIVLAFRLRGEHLKYREAPISWGRVENSSINIWSYGLGYLAAILGILRPRDWQAVAPYEFATDQIFPSGRLAAAREPLLPQERIVLEQPKSAG